MSWSNFHETCVFLKLRISSGTPKSLKYGKVILEIYSSTSLLNQLKAFLLTKEETTTLLFGDGKNDIDFYSSLTSSIAGFSSQSKILISS